MLMLRGRAVLPPWGRAWGIGVVASGASYGAYAVSIWAMTLAPIAVVAALRETSILFAVLIGWLAFGERMDRTKAVAAVMIRAIARFVGEAGANHRSAHIVAIVLRERPLRDVTAEEIASVLVAAIRREGLGMLTWSAHATALRARLAFAHRHDAAAFADVADASLIESLEDWLVPALDGVRKKSDLARVDLGAALLARLPWAARARLDAFAPTHLDVPSGSRISIDYADPTQPVLAVKLQELFGLLETPRIAEGRAPLVLHLLSPAGRPVQVTRDLASFWRDGYFEVRRDLKGRYPRHPWPDDPVTAAPTRRVKPRGT